MLFRSPVESSRRARPRVLHCIGTLGPGGAERQLCNLLAAMARDGWDVGLLPTLDLSGDGGHYLPFLRQAGVPIHSLEPMTGLGNSPVAVRLPLFPQLFAAFRRQAPDVVHCWLDYNNVAAGVAAVLAGVPLVVLSTRSVNPTHFPPLYQPWFRPWYQLLADQPRARFINNSARGAADYADWIGVPAKSFRVIRNGIDPATVVRPGPEAVAAVRREASVPANAPLIAGVFRLSEEKQPLVFVEVVCRVMAARPDAHALVAGIGPLDSEVRRAVAASGFSERIHLLGRRQDVPAVLAAADLVLLTSRHEGTPNVLLEADRKSVV